MKRFTTLVILMLIVSTVHAVSRDCSKPFTVIADAFTDTDGPLGGIAENACSLYDLGNAIVALQNKPLVAGACSLGPLTFLNNNATHSLTARSLAPPFDGVGPPLESLDAVALVFDCVAPVLPVPTVVVTGINSQTVGSNTSLTATVTGGVAPTGTVTFFDNGVTFAWCGGAAGFTLVNGAVLCQTSVLHIGTHAITAHYNGDANNTGSTSPAFTLRVRPIQPKNVR